MCGGARTADPKTPYHMLEMQASNVSMKRCAEYRRVAEKALQEDENEKQNDPGDDEDRSDDDGIDVVIMKMKETVNVKKVMVRTVITVLMMMEKTEIVRRVMTVLMTMERILIVGMVITILMTMEWTVMVRTEIAVLIKMERTVIVKMAMTVLMRMVRRVVVKTVRQSVIISKTESSSTPRRCKGGGRQGPVGRLCLHRGLDFILQR